LNYKITIAFILLAILSVIIYYINPFSEMENAQLAQPWFYQVSNDDMVSIKITHTGSEVSFIKTPLETWAFEGDAGIPPSMDRFGGIAYILGGPQTNRDLTETQIIIEDPAQYGLANPHTIVDIGLTLNRNLQFRLGDKTTNGNNHYGQIAGFPQLFLIADSWGNVLSKLADNPPYPKWYTYRDPLTVNEIKILPKGADISDQNPIRFTKQSDSSWVVNDSNISTGPVKVDMEKWQKILPLLSRPEGVIVSIPNVKDKDYSPWGMTDNSAEIEIRFEGATQQGIIFIDGYTLIIGNKTDTGNYYYGMPDYGGILEPVLNIPAEWVETLLDLSEYISTSR
jgi:hypothetical protein